MALQILGSGPNPEVVARQLREAIEQTIAGAEVDVGVESPGHFRVRVVSAEFEGKSRVRQQQLVYGAIAPLMSGNDAPVHAIDRMECVLP